MRSFLNCLAAVALFVSAPAHAAWQEARSKHFIIYANESAKEIRS